MKTAATALAAQREQRLADGRDADPQGGRGLVQADEVAGTHLAAHDPGPDVVGHLLGELRTLRESCGGHVRHLVSQEGAPAEGAVDR